MTPQSLRAAGLALLAASVVACDGGKSRLSGTVTYKGQPLKAGQVFVKASNGAELSGVINPDGTYLIPNVSRGTHQVKIESIDEDGFIEYNRALAGRTKGGDPIGPDGKPRPKGSPILEASAWSKIPTRYGEYSTSGLSADVKDSRVTGDFDLVD